MPTYQFYARTGIRYEFYPFFLECSMKETDMIKKRHLEHLAFGKAGVIISNLYITENGNFKIPREYSDEERQALQTCME